MALKINEISVKGYEKVIHATNETTKLDCIISIHNTKLGPALGGVRSWSYKSFDEQKTDALRLSEAMTLKNSVCGINFGGGKAVLNLKGVKKTLSENEMQCLELNPINPAPSYSNVMPDSHPVFF